MLHSRMARVAELVKEALGKIIDQELNNPKIPPFVTVHSVKVARDLRVAEVNVTFLQDEDEATIEETVHELNRASGFIRGELARRITLKYLPVLRFHYNPSTREAAKMEKIFAELDEGSEQSEDRASGQDASEE